MAVTTTIRRQQKRGLMCLWSAVLVGFVLLTSSNASAQVPQLTENLQADLEWSYDLRAAYKEYRESTAKSDHRDRSMKQYYERLMAEGDALVEMIQQEQGEDSMGAALLKLEIASHLWQPKFQDYGRYQIYILDGVSMVARIEGTLPDYGAFLLSHLAFLQYEHGQQFEGESLMRHVIENGGINQLRGHTNHVARMLGDDDSKLNKDNPEQLSVQLGRLSGMVQALRLTNEPTRAERYEQRRKALIKNQ